MIRTPIIIISWLLVAVISCGGPIHEPDPWEAYEGPRHEELIAAWWNAHGIESQPIVLHWCHGRGRGPAYNPDTRTICMVLTEGSWVMQFPRAQMRLAHEATMAHEFGEHVYATQLSEHERGHDWVADCLAGAYWGDVHGTSSAKWVGFFVWRQIAIVLEEPDRSRVEPWMLGAREGLGACHDEL